MLKNYMKTAFRNFQRHKTYFLINVLGLAIGFASCHLIFTYIQDELSYDKHHAKGDRIYKVCRKTKIANIEGVAASTTPPLAKMLKQDFAGIENAARLSIWNFESIVRYNDKKFFEKRIIAVDSSFLNIFTIPFIAGNPRTALTQPNSMVVTQGTAQKYFGKENPVGKTLRYWEDDYLVTGVVENCPTHSHFQYDFIISLNSLRQLQENDWWQHALTTFVLLNENTSAADIERGLPAFVKKHFFGNDNVAFNNFSSAGNYYNLFLQPLSDVYLNADIEESYGVRGNRQTLVALFVVAMLIVIVAGINYVNLTTALSMVRNKEAAVRRILGGSRTDLFIQLAVETFIITSVSYVLSLLIAGLALPVFGQITEKLYDPAGLFNPVSSIALFGFVLLTSLLASSYVAAVFSFSGVTKILKNEAPVVKRGMLKNGLVVFQFSVCIAIIIAALVVFRQMQFIRNKNLGFNKENTIVLYPTNIFGDQRKLLKQELLKNHQVLYVSNTGEALGDIFNNMGHSLEDGRGGYIFTFWADYDFKDAFGLKLKAGRYFSRSFSTDENSVLLNESAAAMLGLKDPIGKRFRSPGKVFRREGFQTIIGVVEDFHFNSLHHQIKPLIIYPNDEYWGRNIYIKIRSEDIPETIRSIENTWNTFAGDQPFLYTFLDDDLNRFYKNADSAMLILTIFSLLSIFIACLGLWGIVSFTTIRKTKEIAVRKALGSSASNIFLLIAHGLLKWVVIANIIAWPIAYYAMNRWLQDFAYRIEISWWMFALAGGIALAIALATVSFQAIKAATANPVESLRYE